MRKNRQCRADGTTEDGVRVGNEELEGSARWRVLVAGEDGDTVGNVEEMEGSARWRVPVAGNKVSELCTNGH